MRAGSRARVTIVDVAVWLAAVAAIAGLWPVYADVIEGASGQVGGGVLLVFKTVPPLMVVVLLATIIAKAGIGAK